MESRIATYLVFLFLVSACGPKSFDSKEDMMAYLRDSENGYHFQKSVNGIDYSLMYRPIDLLVIQSMGDGKNRGEVGQLREKYGAYLYFNLSMSANGKELLGQNLGSRAEFGAMVNQLAFDMGDKVSLISQKRDTFDLLDYSYPRLYGMGGSTDMLLVYEKEPKDMQQDYLLFSIRDLGFGTGEVSFRVDTKKIKQQPQLKF